MARISFRPALCAVAVVSLISVAGCSGPSGDPMEQANEYISEVNEAIDEHNRLYEEARGTYEEAREAVESGGDPSEEVENVTQARETLEEARGSLLEAREPLAEVQNLEDVEPEVREYAALLSQAIEAQISTEDQEMEFYQILEEDPDLEDDRETATDLLAEIDEGYQRAEDAYTRAQEFADDNPGLIEGG